MVAAYSPRDQRVQNVAKRIADSLYNNQTPNYVPKATELLLRDEAESGQQFGQNVQKTFPLADVIINTSDQETARSQVARFVEVVFGNTFHTPSRDEQGMFHAYAAAFRSSSLARQVGAALCDGKGRVIATGTNDVAKKGGGLYWDGDVGDGRDFRRQQDSSDTMRKNLLADILKRLVSKDWLSAQIKDLPIAKMLDEALHSGDPFMKEALFMNNIDYVRAVHAEMAAITDCARSGTPTEDATLYSTTFPCHDCAKHIVASGIIRVVYIEPYPKSLVQDLYGDSIAVDALFRSSERVHFDPFVGIAPKRYTECFTARRRKDELGQVLPWQRSNASPNLPMYLPSSEIRLAAETGEFKRFMDKMEEKELAVKEVS